jgi:3-isopropylmalate/(R)-2-methylmalate dehydratase small subunit
VILEGRAVVIPGADVDTDVMYPGQFLNIEGFDPSLRDQLGDDAILVTGPNFGIGSSREHVPQAMKAWGVQAVVGPSFARIFRRNCVNLGLPVLEASEAAAAARPGSRIRIDTEAGRVEVDGRDYPAAPVAPLVQEVQSAGGLIPHAQSRVRS